MSNNTPIGQEFEIKFALVDDNGKETPVAPNLAELVTAWEVEVIEPEDDDTGGFLVAEDSDDAGEEDDDGDEDAAEMRILTLRTKLSQAAIAEYKELTENLDQSLRIDVVYGVPGTACVVKRFECDTDIDLHVPESSKGGSSDVPMEFELLFDCYGTEVFTL